MSYSWQPGAGFLHIGININSKSNNQRIKCPACGGHNFILETTRMYGRCFNCPFTADEPAYVAKELGMTISEARRWIESKEGIAPNFWKTTSKTERIVNKVERAENTEADNATKDDTYRAFLSELTLSTKNIADMKARCLVDEDTLTAWNYKTFPAKEEVDFFAICKKLQRDGHVLDGVPGFFRCKDGKGDFMFHAITKGIIMPQVNYQNQIVGLQIRKDDEALLYREDLEDYEPKCTWFTSSGRPCGAKAHAGVHYACDWRYSVEKATYEPLYGKGFCLTEGFMKADIIHYLCPSLPVIAIPGVNATTELEMELLRLKNWGVEVIRLAFDMDKETKEGVKKATEKVKILISKSGLTCIDTNWDTTIEENPQVTLKGFDDYLSYIKLGIIPKPKRITPSEEVVS